MTSPDFGAHAGGDVIELCAVFHHNGDKGAAIRELCDITGIEYTESTQWREFIKNFRAAINAYHADLRPEDRNYLHDRCITDETIERFKIGFVTAKTASKYGFCSGHVNRLLFPYWKNGNPEYAVSRDRGIEPREMRIDSKGKPREYYTMGSERGKEVHKYKKMWRGEGQGLNDHIIWGLHTLNTRDPQNIDYGKTEDDTNRKDKGTENLLILEGMFDAMSFEQEGYHVISAITGSFAGQTLKQVLDMCKSSGHSRVVICYDNDKAGNSFSVKMMKALFARRIPFVTVIVPHEVDGYSGPIKDVSDYYCARYQVYSAQNVSGETKNDEPFDPCKELIDRAIDGPLALARATIESIEDYRNFMFEFERWADEYKLEAILYDVAKRFPQWDIKVLKGIFKEAKKCPPDYICAESVIKKHPNLRYSDSTGFLNYEGDNSGKWGRFTETDTLQIIGPELGKWESGAKLKSVLHVLKSRANSHGMIRLDAQPVLEPV